MENGKIFGPAIKAAKKMNMRLINEELRLIFPEGKTPNQAIWTKIKKQVLHVKWEAVFFNGNIVDVIEAPNGEKIKVMVKDQGYSYSSWPQNAKQQWIHNKSRIASHK